MIYYCVLKNRKYRFYRGCEGDKSGKTYCVFLKTLQWVRPCMFLYLLFIYKKNLSIMIGL